MKAKSTYNEAIQVDAVAETTKAILVASAAVMKVHGDDPQGIPILAAGFAGAINKIDESIFPKFRMLMMKLLERTAP